LRGAILVLCFREPNVLRAALPVYRAADLDVFLHVDAKLDQAAYLRALGPPAADCRLVEDRQTVFWGGFSMIRAEMALLRDALQRDAYDSFTLVSDDSFPWLTA